MQSPLRGWNVLAIVVVGLAVLGFFAGPLLPGIIGIYAIFAVPLVPVVGVILGIVALRQIRRSGEKGKVAAWIGTTLSALQLLGLALLLLLGVAITAQNKNVTIADEVRQVTSGSQEIQLSDSSIDKKNISQIHGISELLPKLKAKYGQYPSESEFFEVTGLDRAYVTYTVFNNGNEAVVRIALQEERHPMLESSMDSDGVVGGLDCADEQQYLCVVYPAQ